MLSAHFLARAGRELSVEPKILRPDTIAAMQQLPWQGNVRQLENTCRWLTVMASGREIFPNDLPPELRAQATTPVSPAPLSTAPTQTGLSSAVTATSLPSAEMSASAMTIGTASAADWQGLLAVWAKNSLQNGDQQILNQALPAFEKVMIEVALAHSQGKKRLAAELLGWGRNTLTRKLRELGMSDGDDDDEVG